MNSTIVVRCVGTPTFLLAFASPPVAKIQFPNRVCVSSHEPMMVKMIHQRIAIWNFVAADRDRATEDVLQRVVARYQVEIADLHRIGDLLGHARG